MSTLFQRLKLYRLDSLPRHKKIELGEIIKQDFFSQPIKKQYKKVTQIENRVAVSVLFYEPSYTPRMDELIKNYCEEKLGFPRPPARELIKPIKQDRPQTFVSREIENSTGKRERKRIPAKKPAYSVRLNK
jgi:hypothetical protein